jgi:hypothetical protein
MQKPAPHAGRSADGLPVSVESRMTERGQILPEVEFTRGSVWLWPNAPRSLSVRRSTDLTAEQLPKPEQLQPPPEYP